MKNQYTIIDDRVEISIIRKNGDTYITIIDYSDLPKVMSAKYSITYSATDGHGNQYAKIGSNTMLHRFIMDCPDDAVIDHKNHNGLDNRRCNLHIVSCGLNNQNLIPRHGTSSKFRGVYLHNGKWEASATINGQKYYLGIYATELEASQVASSFRNMYMDNALLDKSTQEHTNPSYRPSIPIQISMRKSKWYTRISFKGTRYHVGIYNNEEEAKNNAEALLQKVINHFDTIGELMVFTKPTRRCGIYYNSKTCIWRVRIFDNGKEIYGFPSVYHDKESAENYMSVIKSTWED